MEYWVEVNLLVPREAQDEVLLDVLRPHVEKLKKRGMLVTYHFFREPEIRFRVRVRTLSARRKEIHEMTVMAEALRKRGLLSVWHFGNHGEDGVEYSGEEDRYGKNGWKIAQSYFNWGSETALGLIALKRRRALENPLWAKGEGNPWEGGDRNPWRERQEDPLVYHWSRYVHLFTNQLGFDIGDEVKLCDHQAKRYSEVFEMGMRW